MYEDPIARRICRWADITPNACCFQGGGQTFSYAELARRSDGLARLIRPAPDASGPVLCFGDLNFHMIACFLACIKAGRPYIPVDSATPAERLEAICRISGCQTVFATAPWPLSDTAGNVIPARAIEHVTPLRASGDFPRAVNGDDGFYIIFTSGTTGSPKGVQISHDNLLSFTNWMLEDFGIGARKRFLLQAPYSFDLSVMSLYPALLTGGTLVAVEPDMALDFRRLFAAIPAMNLDIWVSTPSFADVCLADAGFNGKENPNLTHLLFCGDELTHSTAVKLTERFPRARIFNTYGPTEATVAVTKIEIGTEALSAQSRLPVGYAKPDTSILIAGGGGRELPEGEEGEIIIAGPAVSKGYLNDPARTAEAFFSHKAGRAYRTGDAGLMRDGLLYYKGRLDFQVKFHGYRIELQDIERHLVKDPAVRAAMVVPRYRGYKVDKLVAYVVPAEPADTPDTPPEPADTPNTPPEPADTPDTPPAPAAPNTPAGERARTSAIKQRLAGSVMDYMVPQKFVYVDELPLTSNGKLDRKRVTEEVNRS